jgi:hypothetical protein
VKISHPYKTTDKILCPTSLNTERKRKNSVLNRNRFTVGIFTKMIFTLTKSRRTRPREIQSFGKKTLMENIL